MILDLEPTTENLHRTDINTALIPSQRLQYDSYDWFKRGEAVLAEKDAINPEVVLIGDSITHFWGGKHNFGVHTYHPSYDETFEGMRVMNIGYGWDRTQNMLYRITKGKQLEGINPKVVVVNAGTNNTSTTDAARGNTAEEIAEGVVEVITQFKQRFPEIKVVLMAIFPREHEPTNERRILIVEANKLLKEYALNEPNLIYLDLWGKFLTPKGLLPQELCGDYCHPTEEGYKVWGSALRPVLIDLLKNA
jgi:lysophospholipase L1-like esterase